MSGVGHGGQQLDQSCLLLCCCLKFSPPHSPAALPSVVGSAASAAVAREMSANGGSALRPLGALGGLASHLLGSTPLIARIALGLSLFSLLLTTLPARLGLHEQLVQNTALCPAAWGSFTAGRFAILWHMLLSPLVHVDFVSGTLACFGFLQLLTRIERQKGSVASVQLLVCAAVVSQSMLYLFVHLALSSPTLSSLFHFLHLNLSSTSPSHGGTITLLGSSPEQLASSGHGPLSLASLASVHLPTQACATGPFGVLAALVVYECNTLAKEFKRYVFLIPVALPTRVVPLVMLLLYNAWFGVQLHTWAGFVAGYILPFLLLPARLLRLCETQWLRSCDSFVPLWRAGRMQPYRHFVPEDSALSHSHSDLLRAAREGTAVTGEGSAPAQTVPVDQAGRVPPPPPPASVRAGRAAMAQSAAGGGSWRRIDASESESDSSSTDDASDAGENERLTPASPVIASPSSAFASASSSSPPPPPPPRLSPDDDALRVTEDEAARFAANVARILQPAYLPTARPDE